MEKYNQANFGSFKQKPHRLMVWARLYRQKPSRAHGFCTLDFDLFFMLCERGCIDQKRHRLTKKYNLAQIRHDFNTIFKFSERGSIVKKFHKLRENTTSLSLSVSDSSGSLYLSVSVCLSLLVCLCPCMPLSKFRILKVAQKPFSKSVQNELFR